MSTLLGKTKTSTKQLTVVRLVDLVARNFRSKFFFQCSSYLVFFGLLENFFNNLHALILLHSICHSYDVIKTISK